MEMTRQRVRPSLIHTFAETCPTCDGIGMVQGRDTTITKIERWLARAEAFGKEKRYTVFVHPAVFEHLIENEEERLTTLRSCTILSIDIVADAKIGIDEFHIFSAAGGAEVTDEYDVGTKRTGSSSKNSVSSEKRTAKPNGENKIKFGRKPKPARKR